MWQTILGVDRENQRTRVFFTSASRVAVFDVNSVVSATLNAAPCFQDPSQDPGNTTCVNSWLLKVFIVTVWRSESHGLHPMTSFPANWEGFTLCCWLSDSPQTLVWICAFLSPQDMRKTQPRKGIYTCISTGVSQCWRVIHSQVIHNCNFTFFQM